jgi:alkylation response protein AidB-like acyl-CoA dehydrogenase
VLEWLTAVYDQRRLASWGRDQAKAAPDSDPVTGQIFIANVANGTNPVPTREPTDPAPVMAIFGGTTEIQKEIIARGLGL